MDLGVFITSEMMNRDLVDYWKVCLAYRNITSGVFLF